MKTIKQILQVLILSALLLALAAPLNGPARASGVVGDGTPGSCTAEAFIAALAGGGEVTFNCGPYLIVIDLDGVQTISQDTSIDAANEQIMLASTVGRIFTVETEATLTLKNIRLGGSIADQDGGAIYNQGTLHIENTIIHNSFIEGNFTRGGAIFNAGSAHLTNTLVYDTHARDGGAIYNTGNMQFSGVILRDNIANANGGAIYNTGSLNGTAVWLDANQVLLVNEEGSGQGGAIYNSGTVNLTAASFTGNIAGAGGGLYNISSATLSEAAFRDNRANAPNNVGGAGGGITNRAAATLSLSASTLSGNQSLAGRGGGLGNEGMVTLNGVTFKANSAELGGGMYNNSIQSITMTNLTFSENAAAGASGLGGGLFSGSLATLIHATFIDNSAPADAGGAIYHRTVLPGNDLYLLNTIIAESTSGSNCTESVLNKSHIISNGNNLSDDDTCKLIEATDLIETDVMLYPLGFYDGKTYTHLPISGSPAIDNGACQSTVTIDQRGVSRPQGAGCDIGAVEARSAEQPLNWLYIPLVFRQS